MLEIGNSEEQLLGVHIDSKLSFEYHTSKLGAHARISPYMDQNKLRNLMRAFISSQFQYCPLSWMFHGRQLNHKINKIQAGVAPGIFRRGADSSDEGAKIRLSGYCKCQKSPTK